MQQPYWPTRMLSWLDKRIPPASHFALDMRSIFIFPSRFGFLYLFLCVLLFLLGTNYQNNLMLFLCYFLLAMFLVNLLSAYQNFARLKVQLGKIRAVYASDSVQLPLWLDEQTSGQRAHGRVFAGLWRQPMSCEIDLDNDPNPHYLALPTTVRGYLSLPRITLNSYYPLGLFRCWTHLAFDSRVWVYPKPQPCTVALTPSNTAQNEGEVQLSHPGYDEFDSLKPYQQGEPLKHVAWKHLARGRGMISKQFASLTSESGWLKLQPHAADKLEAHLSQLCYQVLELSKQDARFGLDLGVRKIPPDNGLMHQQRCLEALAIYGKGDHLAD